MYMTLTLKSGPILPLLHSDHYRPRYTSTILYAPQTEQGSVTMPCALKINKAVIDSVTDIEETAPRIRADFRPIDDALIQGQKMKQWRRERRLKRIITVAVGWSTIALMIYLIAVTKTTAMKIWDPYDILEISRVRILLCNVCWLADPLSLRMINK